MSDLYIQGGAPLEGELTVQGAKNSVLPVLAGCVLARGQVELSNCPVLSDVSAALAILRHLGCAVARRGHRVTVDGSAVTGHTIPAELMGAMRSSIIFLGPVLARTGEVHLTCPGGCELGPRPIDLHLQAIRELGCRVVEDDEGGIHCYGIPRGGEIHLSFPSVGATENAMLCAAGASGDTIIFNAAREPEIVQLQEFLAALGVRVSGAGGSVILIRGGGHPGGGTCRIMADRIVAATLLCGAAAAGGEVCLRGADWRHLSTVLCALKQAGCTVTSGGDRIRLSRDPVVPLTGADPIRTAPYPGFPTDAQAPVMAALCAGRGTTYFEENLFDSRYRHVPALREMGADITVRGSVALVHGVERLHGAPVAASDLRGGGALAVAALGAEGETLISGIAHIDRGYEALEEQLRQLGARAYRR